MHKDNDIALKDVALVARCRLGDRKAMAQLVDQYQRPVFNAAYRIIGDTDNAADITQTVFLKVFEHLDDYDDKFRFFSWIYRIAINESLNQIKKQRAHEPYEESQAPEQLGPEQRLDSKRVGSRIQGALMELSADQRTVVVMKHMSGYSYQQISEVLQVPPKTVKSRLYSARQLMKKTLLSDSSNETG